MTTLLVGAVDQLRMSVGYIAGGPITNIARHLILGVLDRIQVGQLVIEEKGKTTICGSQNIAIGPPPGVATVLRVKSDAFWTRVALFADMVSARNPGMVCINEAGLRRKLHVRRV